MDDSFIWLFFLAVVGAIVYVVAWILLALLARIFSLVVAYWGITFVGSFLVGILVGAVLPIRVLAGKGKGGLRVVAPPGVTEWAVIGRRPSSPNAEYGWDSAWPNYMPYQAREDALGVYREALHHAVACFNWSRLNLSLGEGSSRTGSGHQKVYQRIFLNVLWVLILLPTVGGYVLGVMIATSVWLIVMGAVGLFIVGLQYIFCRAHVLLAQQRHRRRQISVKCPYCYGKTTLPGFRCQNPDCDVVHWSLLPGPQGVLSRLCSCGVRLPNTAAAAAKCLTPVCPSCGRDLLKGTGSRQTVQVALVGSIGAGKSLLFDTAITELKNALENVGGSLTPLGSEAELYFDQAVVRRQQAIPTAKTQHARPVGLAFLVQKGTVQVELQLMDAAGEAFVDWEETANLRYLDTAETLIVVLDPLVLPRIRDNLRQSRYANSVLLASEDQEEAYGAAVDRLRADSVPLNKRGLAVVLTKGDVLAQLAVASSADLTDSSSIRQWLIDSDCDLLVKRFEKDFRDVRYFLVDSMSKHDLQSYQNPWWVIDWVLNEAKSPLRLGRQVMAASASQRVRVPDQRNAPRASHKRTDSDN